MIVLIYGGNPIQEQIHLNNNDNIMKNKLYHKIAFYSLLLGWFPFMWIAAFGYWHREYGVWIALSGLLFCMYGTLLFAPILRDTDLFKSIDQLEEERTKLFETRKRLENKIKSL